MALPVGGSAPWRRGEVRRPTAWEFVLAALGGWPVAREAGVAGDMGAEGWPAAWELGGGRRRG
jgi:hypothetical protein